MSFLIVSGTGTEVGKTVATAAIAANARSSGRSVVVVKPAQTGLADGEDGDLREIARLSGVTAHREFIRYADPLAPAAAARLSGRPTLDLKERVPELLALADDFDLVLIEGAGGLQVRFDDAPTSIADLAAWLGAPVLLVVNASLGTLSHTELTLHYMQTMGITSEGLVIGSWPRHPDLAMRANLHDLELISDRSLRGVLPAGTGRLTVSDFAQVAAASLDPDLGGHFDAAQFRLAHDPPIPKAGQ